MRRHVMMDHEWPRSRFWLCHFLYNRHQRAAIIWNDDENTPPAEPACSAIGQFLDWQTGFDRAGRSRLVDRATAQCADDPAYIQSLRLFIREEEHHQANVQRWLEQRGQSSIPADSLRSLLRGITRPLGVRFELSIVLISEIVTLTLNRMLFDQSSDVVLNGVLRQLMTDQEQHIAFHSERLTAEYADFNFIRRNLRRWRLRSLHAVLVRVAAWRHRSMLKAMNIEPKVFKRISCANFETILGRMVPYRREALLKTLVEQREQRYEKPTRV